MTLVKQQYETGVGRIDILFRDEEGRYLVVETKKGRESDRVVGQLLRYMGWLKVQEEAEVRGLIVSGEPDVRLDYAAAAIPDVAVITYRVSFQLSPAATPDRR